MRRPIPIFIVIDTCECMQCKIDSIKDWIVRSIKFSPYTVEDSVFEIIEYAVDATVRKEMGYYEEKPTIDDLSFTCSDIKIGKSYKALKLLNERIQLLKQTNFRWPPTVIFITGSTCNCMLYHEFADKIKSIEGIEIYALCTNQNVSIDYVKYLTSNIYYLELFLSSRFLINYEYEESDLYNIFPRIKILEYV